MDAIEILGGLLGKKSTSGGSLGGKILKDILFGGGQPQAQQPRAQPQSYPGSGRSAGPMDIEQSARELEDLLNVATGRAPSRNTPPTPQTQNFPSPKSTGTQYPYAEKPDPRYETTRTVPAPAPRSTPGSRFPAAPRDQNEQAVVMIRAMVNAAKADGEITPDEQQTMLEQVGKSQEAVDFLRREISRPLNVREFAWSVPLGMEQQVYTMSLIGMNLDTQAEADYLLELAHGLRIGPELRRQIHAHYGAPEIEG